MASAFYTSISYSQHGPAFLWPLAHSLVDGIRHNPPTSLNWLILTMIAAKRKPEQRSSTRLLRQLRVRRVNVDVAGLVVHTSNVSRDGAQLVCPAMRFPALKQQLASKRVEIVVEVPTGRELRALV